jgi:hypothetical protein
MVRRELAGEFRPLKIIPESQREIFDWRQVHEDVTYQEVCIDPFDAVKSYLKKIVPDLVQD